MKILKFNPKDIKNIFLSTNKHQDPLLSFYEYVILETGLEVEFLSNPQALNITKIKLNDNDYKVVREDLLVKYCKKNLSFASEHSLKLAAGLHDLTIGPSTGNDIPSGEIHLLDGWL